MPDERTVGVEYKLNVLRPPLTSAEAKKAHRDYPNTRFCQAAIVVARHGPGAVIVESIDGRAPGAGTALDGQTQFEMWLMFTRKLYATGECPFAMRNFLGRVLQEYDVECAR
jgi:hypothetical protein